MPKAKQQPDLMAAPERRLLPCPNPFCDGYGDIDISPGITGRSRAVGACKVGPHPYPHPLSAAAPRERQADA